MSMTPQKRLLEYPISGLIVNASNKLHCSPCNKTIDHLKKSSIKQHIETENHQQNSKRLKTICSLDFNNEDSRDKFHQDLLIWLTSSNISLEKLNKKNFTGFLNQYLRTEFRIPSTTTARRFLPSVYKIKFEELIDFFSNETIAVMVDETNDCKQRFVLQILFIKLNLNDDSSPKLINTLFLDQVNYETVSRSVLDSLVEMKIKWVNVKYFVSDNVAYMKKAYNSVLKTIIYESNHITCFAHIIALVGDTWRTYLSDVDSVISNFKSIFCRSVQRKQRFIDFQVKMNVEKPKFFPDPVVTRWNTWFKSLKFISQNFDLLKQFVESEIEIDDTLALNRLNTLFEKNNVQKEMEFVSSRCDKFKFAILGFEERNFKPTEVYNCINDLYFWLVSQLDLSKNSNTFEDKLATDLFSLAITKLKKYFIEGHQPAMDLFRIIRIFDPYQVHLFPENLLNINVPVSFYNIIVDEWGIYVNICKELQLHSDNFSLEKWWKNSKSRLPNLYSSRKLDPANSFYFM